jgi:hypothetical protein
VVFRHGVVETSTVLGEMFNAGLFFQCPSHVGNPSDEDERLAAELDQDSCKKDPPEKKTQWEHLAEKRTAWSEDGRVSRFLAIRVTKEVAKLGTVSHVMVMSLRSKWAASPFSTQPSGRSRRYTRACSSMAAV